MSQNHHSHHSKEMGGWGVEERGRGEEERSREGGRWSERVREGEEEKGGVFRSYSLTQTLDFTAHFKSADWNHLP